VYGVPVTAAADRERRRVHIFVRLQERWSCEALAKAVKARRNDVAKFFSPELVDIARFGQK
jgi:hypothetical protein